VRAPVAAVLVVVLALAPAACLHDHLVSCGDLACPTSATCLADQCVPNVAIAACLDVPDGASCSVGPFDGTCMSAVCVRSGCRNAACTPLDTCPPIGTTPHFGGLHEAFGQPCVDYQVSEAQDVALARCNPPAPGVFAGPADGPLAAIPPLASQPITAARLAPEGDTLFAVEVLPDGSYNGDEFARAADGSWRLLRGLSLSAQPGWLFGVPSRGPARRVLLGPAGQWEATLADGRVTALRGATELDVTIETAQMSPDGLRLTLSGTRLRDSTAGVYYADRASLDMPFRTPDFVAALPAGAAPFMTADCSRLYFDALGSVLYFEQK
jgi:hypothetical protein